MKPMFKPKVLPNWIVAVRCEACKDFWPQMKHPDYCPNCGIQKFTVKRYFEEKV